jgi:hypothetical protein
MPSFDADEVPASKASPEKPYCINDHREYWRDGIYVRARGEIPVNRPDGSKVYLCGRCYYEWLDKRGLSVNAQLLRDPESIPAIHAERIRRASEDF